MGYVVVVDEKGRREVLGDLEQYKREETGRCIKSDGGQLIQSELDERDKSGE